MKKNKSTYDEFIEDASQKELLEKEYKELLISELILAAMQEDHWSVRRLAKAAGVSPTIIQELKSGKKTNVTLDTFAKILDVIGYEITLTPRKTRRKMKKAA